MTHYDYEDAWGTPGIVENPTNCRHHQINFDYDCRDRHDCQGWPSCGDYSCAVKVAMESGSNQRNKYA